MAVESKSETLAFKHEINSYMIMKLKHFLWNTNAKLRGVFTNCKNKQISNQKTKHRNINEVIGTCKKWKFQVYERKY